MSTVLLYDTTLRDGAQREKLSFSCNDKLKIAQRLDAFGVHYVEGGWPGSNPKDAEFFAAAQDLTFHFARLCAFGSTRRKGGRCEDDSNIQALKEAQTPVVTLVGKSSEFQARRVLETSLEENLAMIGESIRYFKERGREVIYDAEHFFDGFKANREYVLATVKTAAQAGADFVTLCDTNGGSLPSEVAAIVASVAHSLECGLGIHAHDDCGCAVANSLAAVQAGCTLVQGTINGYGERVGNANLVTLIPTLQLKLGKSCVTSEKLLDLTHLSRWVAELAILEPDEHAPYVGRSAFAHKGGIHVAAVLKTAESYQHVDPARVGNETRSVVSELSGRGNIVHLVERNGMQADRDGIGFVLERVKELETRGYSFESAEASVELMLTRTREDYEPPFELVDFMVVVEHRHGRGIVTEATVKVRVAGQIVHTAAEGYGPVHALSLALHKALDESFPAIGEVRLTDYKVRILDPDKGTAATTRVLVDFRQGERAWSTVGASANIIEASWIALAESMEYAMLSHSGQGAHQNAAGLVLGETGDNPQLDCV